MYTLLGLTPGVADVHRIVLRRPAATATDYAATLGRDVRAVRRDLRLLVTMGLVREPAEGTYVAVRPDIAIGEVLAQEEDEVRRRAATLDRARGELAAALDDYLGGRERGVPSAEMEHLDDLATIRRRTDEVIGGTQREMLSIITAFDDDEEAIEAARDEDADVLARGVSLRTIYPSTVRDMPHTWAYAAETTALGEQIRLVDEAPARLVVRDREVAIVAADQNDPDAGALVIWSRPVVGTLVALFELVWARATPAFTATATGRDRTLLDLLAAGATDETAARHLGMSVRTVRRTVAALMDELGAESRFAAGAAAVRRGWV